MKASRKIQASLAVLGTVALAASLTACGWEDGPDGDAAGQEAEAQLDELTPLVASVLDSPIPFTGSDGLVHVVYELEVLNAGSRAATIAKVETMSPTGEVLHIMQGQELEERIVPVGAASALVADDPSAITTLDAGRTVVVLMDGTYPSRDEVPAQFTHRFHSTLSAADPTNKLSALYGSVTERTGEVTLGEGEPVGLAPPLAGDNWLVGNGCCAGSPHRRGVLPIDGRLSPFERFAIDWIRVDPALDPASIPKPAVLPSVSVSADATTNDAYLAYVDTADGLLPGPAARPIRCTTALNRRAARQRRPGRVARRDGAPARADGRNQPGSARESVVTWLDRTTGLRRSTMPAQDGVSPTTGSMTFARGPMVRRAAVSWANRLSGFSPAPRSHARIGRWPSSEPVEASRRCPRPMS